MSQLDGEKNNSSNAKTRILFVGSSPLGNGYDPIGFGPEYAAIQTSLKSGHLNNQFELRHCFAATPEKLLEKLTLFEPNILHFACHGEPNKLVLENSTQNPHEVHLENFRAVVRAQQELGLIVFNACLSNQQAASIVDDVDAAIGMNDEIFDEAAIEFARELYRRIFCGFNLGNSFDSAKASLGLKNTGQESLPEIYCKNGIDAAKIKFASKSSTGDSFLGGYGYDDLVERVTNRHDMLTTWPKTVGNKKWIDRPELEQIAKTISDKKQSTSLLLGAKGTGKSALLSQLSSQLAESDSIVISVKAEFLPNTVANSQDFGSELLGTKCDPVELVKHLAARKKVVLIVDQLDAIAELMDRETNRLNVLLDVLKKLHRCPNVHIVASCREFEFRHDVRLENMLANDLRLNLPEWEQVAAVLSEEGYAVERMAPDMQALLRTPWHLKMFLSVATKDASYKSLHSLIQAVWDKSVLNAGGPDGRAELTRELAMRISNDEELWIDAALCNRWPDARDYLVAQDILILEKERRVIGFRHQTYFDYVLATTFAEGNESLVEHIRKKEESLFVRPTMLSGLNWLRDVQRKKYREQIKLIFDSKPRTHIWTLMIEFLGNQANPDEVEASLLLPLLDDKKDGQRVLAAAAFSAGWYQKMILDGRFTNWLKKDADDAAWCIRVLQTGLRTDATRVQTSVRENWFIDPSKDNLTAAVLEELEEWDLPSVKIIETIAARSKIHSIGMIADNIAKQNAAYAPAIVRAALEFQSKNPSDNSYSRRVDRLVKDCDFYELDGLAEDAPKEFLKELFPWLVAYVTDNSMRGSHLNHYLRDNVAELRFDRKLPDDELCVSLCIAAERFSEESPDAFSRFVDRHSSSNMNAPHMVLMRGLLKLCDKKPETVLKYLLADDRRFFIEFGKDSIGLSRQLITALFPCLDADQREQLEEKIIAYKSYTEDFLKSEPASGRKTFLSFSREYRLRLLNSIPDDCISKSAAKFRDDERVQNLSSRTEQIYWEGGMIGSRMTIEEISKAKPADVFNLIDKMIQSEKRTGEEHWDTRFQAGRSGGSRELCSTIQKAVKANPVVGENLLEFLDPEIHDVVIEAILNGFANSEMGTEKLHSHIDEMIARGLDGSNFREAAARGISNRATKENPAPSHVLDMILDWCVNFPSIKKEVSEIGKPEEAILYHVYSRSLMLAAGRGNFIRAYFDCYRVEDPRRPELLQNLLEKLIEIRVAPEVLSEVIYFFRDLFGMDDELATDLYDKAITACPEVLQHKFCAYSIASLVHLVEPQTKVFDWLLLLKKQGNDLSSQIYGELLFLAFHRFGGEQCEALIANEISVGLSPALVGLGYGAGYFWHQPHCRALATRILVEVAKSDDGSNKKVTEYALLLDEESGFIVDQHSEEFIRAAVGNPVLLHKFVDQLAVVSEEFVGPLPNFALEVSKKLLAEIGANTERRYQNAPEALTNIAVTLHRKPATREQGLALFESVLDLNLMAARAAIELLDRKPGSRLTYFHRRRQRRRRRRTTKRHQPRSSHGR